MSRLKVLICGGGVGGNALACWLAKFRYRFDVTLVESFAHLRTQGLQVDLRGHGVTVIRKLGLEQAVRAKCVPELGLQLVDTHGHRWGYFPKSAPGFTSDWEIMRGDLCQLLYDAAKRHVRYRFDTTVTSYTNMDSGSIQVQLANGASEGYDLVIGADGVHSRVRQGMCGAAASDSLRSLHQYIAYCRLPIPAEPGEDYYATTYIATKGRYILTRRHSPDELQVYLTGNNLAKRLDAIDRKDIAAQKDAFVQEFYGAGWKTDQIINLLRQSDDFYCQHEALVKTKPWSQGRVVLLGDAAHSTSTNGYGTSCALIDAYVLAGELVRRLKPDDDLIGNSTAITEALGAYEDVVRPLIDQLQKGLDDQDEGGSGLKGWQIQAFYWAAWIGTALRLYKLAGLFSDRGMKGWELPVYPELDEVAE